MKPFHIYLFRFIALISVSYMLAGCTTHIIRSSELPALQTGSSLKSIQPKAFAFKEFRDVRGTADPSLAFMWVMHEYKLDQPVATVVAMAVRKELERNGHTCVVDGPESKADFVIEGVVYKFGLTHQQYAFFKRVTGEVAVELTITAVSSDKGVLTKRYEGEYHIRSAFGDFKKEIFYQAFLAMLKEMSTDSELIAFLEK